MMPQFLAFFEGGKIFTCDQAQFWCRSKMGFRIYIFQIKRKRRFKKIFLLAIIFPLKNYDLLPQVLKGSNMAILPNLIVFTSCTKYCHKTLCSMKVKIYHKLPRFLLDYHNHNPFFSHSPLP